MIPRPISSLTVVQWNEQWGPLSEVTMRERLRSLEYAVARYCYEPGTLFPMHTHAVDKRDAVLSGLLRIFWEGGSAVLKADDTIDIPAGFPHGAHVVGSAAVVSLDAVKIPGGRRS